MELTARQHRFLSIFLAPRPERLRAKWLRADGKVVCQVAEPFAYEPEAVRVQVYRLADDDTETYRGDATGRRVLPVAALRQLEPCWAVPLRTLSPLGLELARTPHVPHQPPVTRSFTLPYYLDKALEARAGLLGRRVSPILAELIAAWLEGRE